MSIKKIACVGLAATMTVGLAACGQSSDGGNNVAQVDPSVAKQNVYSYEEICKSIEKYDDYSFHDSKLVDSRIKMLVTGYQYNGDGKNETIIVEVGLDGSNEVSYILEMPDMSSYKENAEFQTYGDEYGYGGIYEDAVGDLKTSEDSVVVKTMAVSNDAVFAPAVTEDIAVDDGFIDDVYETYIPEEYEYENYYTNYIQFAEDGSVIGIVEYSYNSSNSEGYMYVDATELCKWDAQGKIVSHGEIKEIKEAQDNGGWAYIGRAILLSSGDFLMIVQGETSQVIVYDADFNLKKTIDASSADFIYDMNAIITMKDGRSAVSYYSYNDDSYGLKFSIIDLDTFTLKEEIKLPAELVTMGFSDITVGSDTDFVVSNGNGVAKFNIGDSNVTYFMNYINSDLPAYSIDDVIVIDDTHFIGTYYDVNYSGMHTALFTYVDPASIPDKQILKMAVYYLNGDMRTAVVDFNKSNSNYRIVVDDYYQYATEDDYNAGYTKLNNEIIAGNIPDILLVDLGSLNINSYVNKGILADIDELMAKDPEISGNKYLTNVFDAFAINGKHYILPYSFGYQSYYVSSDYVGNKDSLTINEFIDLMNSAPDESTFSEYIDRNSFIGTVMTFDGSEFVDLSTGKCEFNSTDFIALLEYAKSLPEEYDYSGFDEYYWQNYQNMYRSGRVIFMDAWLSDIQYLQQRNWEFMDGKGVMVGFPSRNGNGGLIMSASTPIAISAKGNVDGAWQFARQFLLEDYQDQLDWYIPVLESSFDKWAAKALERPYYENEKGEKEYYDYTYYIDGVEYTVPPMTQAELDKIKDTIKSTTKAYYYNSDIIAIIEEEASAFFAGQKSAKDVTDIIQSRVQLYINENQ